VLANTDNQIFSASRGKLKLSVGQYSSAGVKAVNEDSLMVDSPDKPSLSTKGIVAVIADGVSHAKHAKQASYFATREFAKNYYDSPKTWSSHRIISNAINRINTHLYQSKTESDSKILMQNGSSKSPQRLTTLSGIVFKSASAHIFHIGDTQVLRIRKGTIKILTQQHSQPLANHSRLLTRALGADNHIKIDYRVVDLQVGDLFLLTSDGIHESIDNETITQTLSSLQNSASPKYAAKNSGQASLNQLARQLALLATENNSQDNLSSLLIKIDSVPFLQPQEIRKTLLRKVIPPVLSAGQILEGYRIIRPIHSSTRSHLYQVEDVTNGNQFALKAPSSNFSDDDLYLQGFIREAWLGSQFDHRAIMKVYPAKTDAKFLYHICEYIQGQTLRQWMLDHPSPSIDSVREIVSQVVNALRVFKNLDIVHRDIKPENIMIDPLGQIKLIDYGTASIAAIEEQINRISETHPLGTVNYVAPETLNDLRSDSRSDLFSLGVITYEMLTGRFPYPEMNGKNNKKDFSKWIYKSALSFRKDIPFWLDLALMKSVEADPQHRYQIYSEFVTDIRKPNPLVEKEFLERPFIERDPLKFWKIVSASLAALVIYLLSKSSSIIFIF